jgi:hypothetical protein
MSEFLDPFAINWPEDVDPALLERTSQTTLERLAGIVETRAKQEGTHLGPSRYSREQYLLGLHAPGRERSRINLTYYPEHSRFDINGNPVVSLIDVTPDFAHPMHKGYRILQIPDGMDVEVYTHARRDDLSPPLRLPGQAHTREELLQDILRLTDIINHDNAVLEAQDVERELGLPFVPEGKTQALIGLVATGVRLTL